MKLVIISDKTRYHFQKPLSYFSKIEIIHLYKSMYSDSHLNNKDLIQYKNIFQLYSKLKEINPDIIQGLEPYYGYSRFKIPVKILPIIFITLLYCKKYKKPFFYHSLENMVPERKYGWFLSYIMKYIAKVYSKNAVFIFYINNGAKENLMDLGVSQEKISYSLWGIWGVDIDEFRPISNLKKRLVFVGTLLYQKGIIDLIKAVSLARKNASDVALDIIGTGPLKEDIDKLIANLNLNNAVKLIGEVPSDKIADYLADSYILVAPSKELKYWSEQVGMTMIEAASCGVPVISTKTGSISEFVQDGKTGILVEAGQPEKIADAILKLWNNKNLHDTMAKNARKNVLEKYNSMSNIKDIEQKIINIQ
jgi:glycosyltransferase involved in cell wall biosynthesis